jgi:hypothetical protein
MTPEPGQTGPPNPGTAFRKRKALLALVPSPERLHAGTRISLGVCLNVALAVCITGPLGRSPGLLGAILDVALPCATLMVLLPVFLWGRDVPRLLAIGLSFLPAFTAVGAIPQVYSFWSANR